jgi:DNA (cytosine-5)-methyltransferase 1
MLTYLAIAERLKPRWLVWENVPGVLSSNGGKDFGSFLGALGELGYVDWAYRILDAQWFGVAQRRRRVFVVAHLGEGNLAAKVLFESESVRRDTPPSRETRKGLAPDAEGSVDTGCVGAIDTECGGGKLTNQTVMAGHIFPSYWNDQTQPHDTLLARDYKGVGNQDLTSGRLLVPAIPIHDQATRNAGKRGNKQDGKGNGLGVGKPGDPAPTLTKGDKHAIAFQTSELRLTGKLTEKSVCPTLKANTKAGDTEVKVVLYENHPNDSRVTGPHDVAPSCVSRYGTGGGNVPLVQEGVDLYNQALTGDVHCPLRTAGGHGAPAALVQEAVAVDCYNKTIGDKSQSISSSASDINHTGGVINPADRMAVRRLTPRECERLQGFDDDHTLIPWRNKPADQCPDGPRYKALGNSMAVPCMAWIGKRIDAVEKAK